MRIHSKLKADLDYLQVYQNTKKIHFRDECLIENWHLLQPDCQGITIKARQLEALGTPQYKTNRRKVPVPIKINEITRGLIPNAQTYNKVLLLQNAFASNYCHSLIDNLPTILYHDRNSDADVIYTLGSKLLIDQLKYHNIHLNKTIFLNPDETVSFNSQAVCCINSNPDTRHRKILLNFINECVNHSVNCKSTTGIKNRLIYATRNYSDPNLQICRKMQDDNELGIIKLLKYFCDNNNLIFTLFDGYKNGKRMTSSEQSKLFNEAKMVVGPHGGAMSNILYLDPQNDPIVCEFTGGTQSPIHANSVFLKNYSNLYTRYFEEMYDYNLIPFTDDSTYETTKIDIDNLKQFLKL